MDTVGLEVMGAENGSVAQRFCCSMSGQPYTSLQAGIRKLNPRSRRQTFHVRFLIPELLAGGNPAQDLFNLLGLSRKESRFESEVRNSSPDVSILHVLSKNPQLFSDVHDNGLMLALTRALPKEFRSTNIEMLSPEEEGRIEGCFRDESWLLNTYCSDADVDGIYRTHFMARRADARYSDMTESELIYVVSESSWNRLHPAAAKATEAKIEIRNTIPFQSTKSSATRR